MAVQVTAPTAMASNFLVPNGTFFIELAAFALLFFILTKYVIPPINTAMSARQEAIRQEFAEADEAKQQAVAEQQRIKDQAQAQIAAERQQALTSLRSEVGTLATSLAGRIVGESLEDDERSGRVVDRFLADLESLETSKAARNGAPS